MSLEGYRKQFILKLGIDPYPGTLNLQLSEDDSLLLEKIRDRSLLVEGFEDKGKSFGEVICYKAEVSGIGCALIQPRLSKHINTAEIISKGHLRTALGLKDGSVIKVLLS